MRHRGAAASIAGVLAALLVILVVAAVPAFAGNGNGKQSSDQSQGGSSSHEPPGQAKKQGDSSDQSGSSDQSSSDSSSNGDSSDSGSSDSSSNDAHGNANDSSSNAGSQGSSDASGKAHGKSGAHGKGSGNYETGSPGNNGTIKINYASPEPGNANHPHPGCQFTVEFFHFDTGQNPGDATLLFYAHPPTGTDLLYQTTVNISGDDTVAGPFDLSSELAGYTPSHQGYHVKLEVHAPYSQGADTKYKVFWINCTPAAASSAPSPAESPASDTTGGNDTPTPEASPSVGGEQQSQSPEASGSVDDTTSGGPTVQGKELTRANGAVSAASKPAAPIEVLGKTLPFTGADVLPFLITALVLIGLGGILVATRRRRTNN